MAEVGLIPLARTALKSSRGVINDYSHKYHSGQAQKKKTWNIKGVSKEIREAFPEKTYAKPSLIESFFSRVKRKISSQASVLSIATQAKQSLLLGLPCNIYRLGS